MANCPESSQEMSDSLNSQEIADSADESEIAGSPDTSQMGDIPGPSSHSRKTPNPSQMPDSPSDQPLPSSPPLPLTSDEIASDGVFRLVWLVGSGQVNYQTKSRGFINKILKFDQSKMWKTLGRYIPSRRFPDPLAVFTLQHISVLFSGILKLGMAKMEHLSREVQKLQEELNQVQYVACVNPDPITGLMPAISEQELEEVVPDEVEPCQQRVGSKSRRKRKGKKRGGPSQSPSPPPNIDGSVVAEEAVVEGARRQVRKKRRVAVSSSPIPSDAQIIRMLNAKVIEMHGEEDNREYERNVGLTAMVALSPPLPVVPDETEGNVAVDPFCTLFSTDQGQGSQQLLVEEPMPLTGDGERIQARIASARSPNVYIRQNTALDLAPLAVADEEGDSFPILEPIIRGLLSRRAPRQGRARRLSFDEVEIQIPRGELIDCIRPVKMQKLFKKVTKGFAKPPTLIKKPRKGMEMIEWSGRKTPGNTLMAMIVEISKNMPLPDRTELEREEEMIRAQESGEAILSAVVPEMDIADPSAIGASRPELEGTACRSADILAEDLRVHDQDQDISGGGRVEFSMFASPNRSARESAGGQGFQPDAPMDIDVSAGQMSEDGGVGPERTITFSELVPLNTTRLVAARMFFGLLKHQSHKNVAMTQTEAYGEIKIRILNSDIDPSQYEDSFLVEDTSNI